ncbi:MAG: Ldh family oxidoreductase [bacterium]
MTETRETTVFVDHHKLKEFATNLLTAAGLTENDASLVSEYLVETSLRGVDTHGVTLLPHYLRRIQNGTVEPRPNIRFTQLSASTGLVDGGHGLGHLVMNRATIEAISLAKKTGAAWVTVRESSHCGALACFGLRIADEGMIGLVFSHTDTIVLPYGSREPFCGTNPICITAPGERNSICLDMATSRVAAHRVKNAAKKGKGIPLGWAVDEKGNETTDSKQATYLYPFGEYKGSGLGLMIEVFCALLTGSPYGPDISRMYEELHKRRHLGGLVGAMDIARFVSLDDFRCRVTDLLEGLGSLKPVESSGAVLYPGEPEIRSRLERLKNGIPLGRRTLEEFPKAAQPFGLDQTLRMWMGE